MWERRYLGHGVAFFLRGVVFRGAGWIENVFRERGVQSCEFGIALEDGVLDWGQHFGGIWVEALRMVFG